MKTAIIYGPEDIRVEDVPTPEIGPDDVLVQVAASGICGSDVHRYLGTGYGRKSSRYPMNSGHEYCGDVAGVGRKVKTFREGDKVTLGVAWGSGSLGAFSEFVHIPHAVGSLRKLPRDVSHVDGALIETFTVALGSCHRPRPQQGESMLILGAGPIGLCVLLLCRARGIADILVSEPSAKRRALAERIGARTVNPSVDDLAGLVLSTTSGSGVDVTFECAGDEETLSQAFTLTRPAGRISLVGHYRKTPRLDIEHLIIRSLNVYGPEPGHSFFGEAVDLIVQGGVDLAQLVSHTFPIERAQEAFAAACDTSASVKVLFTP